MFFNRYAELNVAKVDDTLSSIIFFDPSENYSVTDRNLISLSSIILTIVQKFFIFLESIKVNFL